MSIGLSFRKFHSPDGSGGGPIRRVGLPEPRPQCASSNSYTCNAGNLFNQMRDPHNQVVRWNRTLVSGKKLTGTVWNANNGDEKWTQVFNGEINNSAGISSKQQSGWIALKGFPGGDINVSPNSFLLFDLQEKKEETAPQTTPGVALAKPPETSAPIAETVNLEPQEHVIQMDQVQELFDQIIPELVKSPSANIRIIRQSNGEELFDLHRRGIPLENRDRMICERQCGGNYQLGFTSNFFNTFFAFEIPPNEKLKIIVEYPKQVLADPIDSIIHRLDVDAGGQWFDTLDRIIPSNLKELPGDRNLRIVLKHEGQEEEIFDLSKIQINGNSVTIKDIHLLYHHKPLLGIWFRNSDSTINKTIGLSHVQPGDELRVIVETKEGSK